MVSTTSPWSDSHWDVQLDVVIDTIIKKLQGMMNVQTLTADTGKFNHLFLNDNELIKLIAGAFKIDAGSIPIDAIFRDLEITRNLVVDNIVANHITSQGYEATSLRLSPVVSGTGLANNTTYQIALLDDYALNPTRPQIPVAGVLDTTQTIHDIPIGTDVHVTGYINEIGGQTPSTGYMPSIAFLASNISGKRFWLLCLFTRTTLLILCTQETANLISSVSVRGSGNTYYLCITTGSNAAGCNVMGTGIHCVIKPAAVTTATVAVSCAVYDTACINWSPRKIPDIQVTGQATTGSIVNAGNLTTGNTAINGTLGVTGAAQLNNNLTVLGNIDDRGNLNVNGNTTLHGTVAIDKDTTIATKLTVPNIDTTNIHSASITNTGNITNGGNITTNSVNAATGTIATLNSTTGNIATVNATTVNGQTGKFLKLLCSEVKTYDDLLNLVKYANNIVSIGSAGKEVDIYTSNDVYAIINGVKYPLALRKDLLGGIIWQGTVDLTVPSVAALPTQPTLPINATTNYTIQTGDIALVQNARNACAYYTASVTGNTVTWIKTSDIPVPANNYTYQWYGLRLSNGLWRHSYILWQPAAQLSTEVWSFVDIDLDAYRTAAAQDIIDAQIVATLTQYIDQQTALIQAQINIIQNTLNTLNGRITAEEQRYPDWLEYERGDPPNGFIYNKPPIIADLYTRDTIIDGGSSNADACYNFIIDGGDDTMSEFMLFDLILEGGSAIASPVWNNRPYQNMNGSYI